MKSTKLIPALAAPALVLGLAAPAAQAAEPKQDVRIAANVVAKSKSRTLLYGEGHYFKRSGYVYLKAVDFTDVGGWRVRASIEKFYRGEWTTVFKCTAANSGGTSCRKKIAGGTLVRVHVWTYKGSSTKYHGYSRNVRV